MQIQLRCKMVVDALGGFSPITRQRRKGRKPDSVVLMVGSCSDGLPKPKTADLLYSFNPLNRQVEPCTAATLRRQQIEGQELAGEKP